MIKDDYFISSVVEQSEKLLLECSDMQYQSTFEKHFNDTALLVLDMQNFFLDKKSRGYLPASSAILPQINSLIDVFRTRSKLIIFTKHSNVESNAKSMAIRWKYLIPPNSKESDLFPLLNYKGEKIIEKHQYDAFYDTSLYEILDQSGIRSIVIAGLVQNLCVESTLRSAFVRGFDPIIPIDCTASYSYPLHLASLKSIAMGFCMPCLSRDILNALEQDI